jgi:protein subunit release factor A
MKTVILEITAAEGGDDSKLLVKDFADAYTKFFERMSWKST